MEYKRTSRIARGVKILIVLAASFCVSGCGGLPGIGFSPWGGGTISVSPGESVQEAVDRAGNGAVILLGSGTWSEAVVIDKPLTLRGEGADRTVLTPASALTMGPVILVTGDRSTVVTIENVKINSPHATATDYVPGVWVEGNSTAVIRGCEIVHNTFGIVVRDNASVTVEDCHVADNFVDGIGNWGATLVVKGSSVVGNVYTGINLNGASLSTVENTDIRRNGFDGIGMIHDAKATVVACEIRDNEVAGISLQQRVQVELSGNRITGNGAYDVWIYEPCNKPWHGAQFHGQVSGSGNAIGTVCPSDFMFLAGQ